MKDSANKIELKFFLGMSILFFILPILIIQIPGIENVGKFVLKPYEFIMKYN